MRDGFTAVIQEQDGWWIGWIAEIPGVNAQEVTREALLDSLSVVLDEALEMNREAARLSAEGPFEEVSIPA